MGACCAGPQPEAAAAADAPQPADGPGTTYVLVKHHVKAGKEEEFWPKLMAQVEKFDELNKGYIKDHGCYCFAFCPMTKQDFICLWEMNAGTSEADLQKLLDETVTFGLVDNEIKLVTLDLCPPPWKSAFGVDFDYDKDRPAGKSDSDMYFVWHNVVDQGWWDFSQVLFKDIPKVIGDGDAIGCAFHHMFAFSKTDLCCTWEIKKGTDFAVAEDHLDKYIGNDFLKNTWMKLDPESLKGVAPFGTRFPLEK